MARMHSRKRGKSGSKKPMHKTKPLWVRYKGKEAELLIVKLAKEGKTFSQIGVIMRDVYGIPDIRLVLNKSVSKVMSEKGLLPKLPEDLMALLKKAVDVKKHIEDNKKDYTAKRGIQLTESKIKRLVKYYKRTGRLDKSWKYDPKRLKLYLE